MEQEIIYEESEKNCGETYIEYPSRRDYYILKLYKCTSTDVFQQRSGKLFRNKKKKERKKRSETANAQRVTATPRPAKITFVAGYLYSLHLAFACVFTTAVNDRYADTKRQPKQIRSHRKRDPTARLERGKESSPHLCPYVFLKRKKRSSIFPSRDLSSLQF